MADSRLETEAHINAVRELLYQVVAKLHERAQVHDASKLEEPEKSAFDRAAGELSSLKYGSKEYKAALAKLGPALAHHYIANSHHPEHYKKGIRGMSLLDLLEMLADWRAATKRMKDGGSMAASLKHNKRRFKIPQALQDILDNTAIELGWQD